MSSITTETNTSIGYLKKSIISLYDYVETMLFIENRKNLER